MTAALPAMQRLMTAPLPALQREEWASWLQLQLGMQHCSGDIINRI
jgi:hypothetical protein